MLANLFGEGEEKIIVLALKKGVYQHLAVSLQLVEAALTLAGEKQQEAIQLVADRTFGCADNLIQSCTVASLEQINPTATWDMCFGIMIALLKRQKDTEHDLLCASSSLCWTILRQASEFQNELKQNRIVLNGDHVAGIISCTTSQTDAAVRVNGIGMLASAVALCGELLLFMSLK